MCHTLLEIPKKRANINHRLLFMKVINVSLSALLLVARFGGRVFGVRPPQQRARLAPPRSLASSRASSLCFSFLSSCQGI